MVKSILEHDLNIINKKPDYRPRWKIRKDDNRLDACYYKVGEQVLGRVSYVFPTYALVDIGSTKYGVLHARDMSKGWVDRVDLTLTPKEDIHVYIKDINQEYNTIKLSLLPPNEYNISQGIDSNNNKNNKYKDNDEEEYNNKINGGLFDNEKEDNIENNENNNNKEKKNKRKERKKLTEYDIEDPVEGVIVRKSPLGFYIDIGATVDGFLHINDIKLTDKMRKSYSGRLNYRDPNKYKIGNKLKELYIKSIDLIKNRIGLTENTLLEELERNVMSGTETPEQQSSYLRNYNLDFMKETRLRDLQIIKMIGGYDEYLKKLNAKRNASIPYLMFLENLQKQKELEDQQKELFKDMSTKQKINRDKDEFNRLAHKISDLIDSAYKPTEDEQSIYKFGDTKIWKPTVYTPFKPTQKLGDEEEEENQEYNKENIENKNKEEKENKEEKQKENKNNKETKSEEYNKEKEIEEQKEINKKYFKTLSDEIIDGLRDIQGENYNLSMKYEHSNKYDEPYKMINYLYDQFYQKPSNISVQTDKYENYRQYVHTSKNPLTEYEGNNLNKEELTEWDQMYWKEQLEKKEKLKKKKLEAINILMKSKDKDEVELGQMLLETIDFDPFEHCKTFKESQESEFIGASRLFQDDVSQWNNRVYNMILKNEIEIPKDIGGTEDYFKKLEKEEQIEVPEIREPLDDEEEIENIDPDILEALDESEQDDFTSPEIYQNDKENKEEYVDTVDYDIEDNEEDIENEEEEMFRADPELLKPIDQQIKREEYNKENGGLFDDEEDDKEKKDYIYYNKYEENDNKEIEEKNIEYYEKNTKNKNEKINIQKMISKLQKNKKLQKNFSKTDSPLTSLLLSEENKDEDNNKDNKEGIQNVELDQEIDPSVNYILKEIKRTVNKMTNNTLNSVKFDNEENEDNKNNKEEGYKEYKEQIEETDNKENDNKEEYQTKEDKEYKEFQDRLNKYIMEKLEDKDNIAQLEEEGGNPFSNKDDFKKLVKYAKQQLTSKDLELVERLMGNDEQNELLEERLMNMLKSVYSREEKKTKYKYYKEGYDQYLLRQHNIQKNIGKGELGKREMQAKLNILLRNKNFINMLKRLDVDPNELTYDNITKLLPQQFQYQRLTPSTASKGEIFSNTGQ